MISTIAADLEKIDEKNIGQMKSRISLILGDHGIAAIEQLSKVQIQNAINEALDYDLPLNADVITKHFEGKKIEKKLKGVLEAIEINGRRKALNSLLCSVSNPELYMEVLAHALGKEFVRLEVEIDSSRPGLEGTRVLHHGARF